jgi:hypothetical protein
MQKTCKKCGKEYEATGGAQKYCVECKGGISTSSEPVFSEAMVIPAFEARLGELERFIHENFPVDFARWEKGDGLAKRKGSLKGN